MDDINVEIGRRVRDIRKRLKYTGERFGEILGVSKGAVSRYELGTSALQIDLLIRIAKLGGTTVDAIVTGAPPASPVEMADADAGEQWVGQSRRAAPRIGEGEACYLKGTVHLSNGELRLLAAFRDIDAAQQSSIIGIAEAFRAANESRTSANGATSEMNRGSERGGE